MTITSAAAEMIRDFVQRSGVRNPVVYLGQASSSPSEPRQLYPLVYPSSRFLWLTTTAEGIPFVARLLYPRDVRRAMKRGVLDVSGKGLVLKDANGTVVLPRYHGAL